MSRTNRSLWPGVIIIIIGLLFLLESLEVASFRYLIRTYWPVLLILVGLGILFRGRRGSDPSRTSERAEPPSLGSETSADRISESSFFGNISLKLTSKNFGGGTLSAVFGGIDLNLSSAELAPGEQRLGMNSVFGSCRVTLPKEVGVFVRASCLFGDMTVMNQKKEGIASEITFKSENYDAAKKKIYINASQVFGDIKIW